MSAKKGFIEQFVSEFGDAGNAISDILDGAIFDAAPNKPEVIPPEKDETPNEPVAPRKPGATFKPTAKAVKPDKSDDKSDKSDDKPDKSDDKPDKSA